MRDKRNESKLKAMLERTGVIRKVELDEASQATDLTGYNPDIKPLFNVPDEAVNVTPAARQPIPGMPTPVFPTEKPVDFSHEQPHVEDTIEAEIARDVEKPMYEQEHAEVYQEPMPQTYAEPAPSASAAYETALQEAQPVAQQNPVSYGGYSPYRETGGYEETYAAAPVAVDRDLQPENYTDRYLNTDELYEALSLTSKKTDSIYLIEEYLHTLPESLPDSSRRDIVSKLLAASGFDYDLLMGDGVLRVKMLKEYAERFARHTDDYIAARQAELDELDQQVLRTRRLIENRKDLHKKQFFSIEAEAQRLKEILTFISG